MPLLDIEKAIKRKDVVSRFRLMNIASQRAKELNSGREDVLDLQVKKYAKITTNALEEIIEDKITFVLLPGEEE